MAEQVSSLLPAIDRGPERTRCPTSYRHMLEALGPLVVEVDVDGEVFALGAVVAGWT